MTDRVVEFPNRFTLTPAPGQADTFDVTPAPGVVTETGTPINKGNLLSDATALALGLDPAADPTVDGALALLASRVLPAYFGAMTVNEAVPANTAIIKVLPHNLGRTPARVRLGFTNVYSAGTPYGMVVDGLNGSGIWRFFIWGNAVASSTTAYSTGVWDRSLVINNWLNGTRVGAGTATGYMVGMYVLGNNASLALTDVGLDASNVTLSIFNNSTGAGTVANYIQMEVYG